MDDIDWKNDRILITPINLYMEYLLLSYNDYLLNKLKDVEITHGELTYIYNIKYFSPISQRQLAEKLYVSEANVAKRIKKLVNKGLVKKTKDENNKSVFTLLVESSMLHSIYLSIWLVIAHNNEAKSVIVTAIVIIFLL